MAHTPTLTDTRKNRRHARHAMERWVADDSDYLDCGEVNATLLGENYSQEHDLYENDGEYSTPDWVWDVAAKIKAP